MVFGDAVTAINTEIQKQSLNAREAVLRSFDPEFLKASLGSDPAELLPLPAPQELHWLQAIPGHSSKSCRRTRALPS